MPSKTWISGESLVAADMNSYLQNQVVSTWSTAAARNTAIPTPTVGMMSFLNDVQSLQVFVGIAWKTLPYGILGSATLTADTSATPYGAAASIIGGMSVACTVTGSNRRVKITQYTTAFCSTPNTLIRMHIYESGGAIQSVWMPCGAGHVAMSSVHILTPSAGVHTFDTYMGCDAGTGYATGAANKPSLMIVEDIGI